MGAALAGRAHLAATQRLKRAFPGFALCAAVGALAYVAGRLVPIVGAPVFAIVFGAALAALWKPPARFESGIRTAGRAVLQIAIVALGLTLQLREVFVVGAGSLPVMLGSAVVTLAAAYVVGRMLYVEPNLRRLLGVGTTICGGSAIAALAGVIEVSQAEFAYAISTVFLFNIIAVLIFPWIGHAFALSPHAFGLWAGTAVNDTSSVVATGFSYDRAAGNYAVIIKLTRTLLIVPIVLFYAGKRAWTQHAKERIAWRAIVPWFIVWFLVAVAVNSLVPIPAAAHAAIAQVALVLIIFALSAVGLAVDVRAMRRVGVRPLLLGLILWGVIACTSLAIAHAYGLK